MLYACPKKRHRTALLRNVVEAAILKERSWLFSGLLCRVVWSKITDVSEVLAAQ
jgi:hypothetical protein